LSVPNGRRSALVFLSDRTDAPVCEDVALAADDQVLAQLAKDVQAKFTTDSTPRDASAIGWTLDLTTLKLLDRLQNAAESGTVSASTPALPDEMAAVLASCAGEVGRHGSSLDEVLRGLVNREDLDNRLLAENLIFLEDSSPASRVRAYDWLNERGKAPAGYDPLGSPEERRKALEAAENPPAPTTAPTADATGDAK